MKYNIRQALDLYMNSSIFQLNFSIFSRGYFMQKSAITRTYELFCMLFTAAAVIFIFAYSFIPSNPDYGRHASTSSNVGRDHRMMFAIWGILIGAALVINIVYALKKFNITSKFPKIMCFMGLVGVIGFISIVNDKMQKYHLVITKENYVGDYADSSVPQVLNSQFDIMNTFMTKKMFHTLFAIVFGLCIAFAILFVFITLARRNKVYKVLVYGFAGYMLIVAAALAFSLSGLVEAVAIDVALLLMFAVNHTHFFEKHDDIECEDIEEVDITALTKDNSDTH